MNDHLPELLGGSLIVVAVLACCLLVGSCVQDYAKSTPRAVDVLIIDKHYDPEHYDTHCNTDSDHHMSCTQYYVPPSWTVVYADERQHTMSVSKGTWDVVRLGERKVVRFDEGGGYWHARYNEQFVFGPMVAEGAAWPTR